MPQYSNGIPAPTEQQLSPAAPYFDLRIGQANPVQIPQAQYFRGATHVMYAHGVIGSMTIDLFDPTGAVLEAIIFSSDGLGTVRYGWVDGPVTDAREFSIVRYRPRFERHGMTIQLVIADRQAIVTPKIPSPRSFPPTGGTAHPLRISDIVRFLLIEDGYDPARIHVEPTAPLHVDPTRADAVFRQEGVANQFFILTQLAPRAVAEATGQSGYNLHFRGDEAWFAPYSLTPKIKRKYTYPRQATNALVTSWSPNLDHLTFLALGGGNLVTRAYDPGEAAYYQRVVSDSGLLASVGAPLPSTNLLSAALATAQAHKQMHVPYGLLEQTSAWAAAKASRARQTLLSGTLETVGDPGVYPMDYVDLTILRPDEQPHYSSGGYFVTGVQHTIQVGTFRSVMALVSALGVGVDQNGQPLQVSPQAGDSSSTTGAVVESEVLP